MTGEGRRGALVVTVSDGVSAGERADESGELLAIRLEELGFEVSRALTADDPGAIAARVREAADDGVPLVVTTGGTGVGPRDRTPEALAGVIDRVVPGIGEAMRAEGRRSTPLASISRSLGAVRGRSLILALPGSPRAARESLAAVEAILEHTLELLEGRTGHAAPPGASDDRAR